MESLSLQDVALSAPATPVQCLHRTTLARRAQGKINPRDTYREQVSLLSAQQQLTLINEINRLTDQGLPPTCAMVRNFAEDMVKKCPGKNWAYEFVRRHQKILKSGVLAAVDLSRKKADNAYQYTLYFELVCSSLNIRLYNNILKVRAKIEQYGILPQNTYNMDEKGFLIGILQKVKRVFNKDSEKRGKLIGAGQDGNHEWITCLATICMDGTYIPPSLIYQATTGNIQDTWLDDFKPDEPDAAHFASSPSGWTNNELGMAWLTTVFDRYTKAKARHGRDWRLLFIDGHGSHVNIPFLDWCLEHRILVAVYPPHSTHRLQPLDVSLFNPLANYYSQELNK